MDENEKAEKLLNLLKAKKAVKSFENEDFINLEFELANSIVKFLHRTNSDDDETTVLVFSAICGITAKHLVATIPQESWKAVLEFIKNMSLLMAQKLKDYGETDVNKS